MMTNISVPDGKVEHQSTLNSIRTQRVPTVYNPSPIIVLCKQPGRLQAIEKFMKNNNIDVIHRQCCKTLGGQGIININYSEDR